MNAETVGPGQVACVTVTFNPDIAHLSKQLNVLPDAARKILVDNGSVNEAKAELERLVASIPEAELLSLPNNRGLGAAVNLGAQRAAASGRRFLLMLDQDSVPCVGAIELLLCAYSDLASAGIPVGCVGPALLDPRTGTKHGFHRIKYGLFWGRGHGRPSEFVRCDGLNGSGTLVELDLFQRLGGLDEEFFIDHVDTEWSFRARKAGYKLFGVPDAVFSHSMGERNVRFWFAGWQLWPVRTPTRHFYLVRNAIKLLRRGYVPAAWKVWAVPKLIATAIVFGFFGAGRRKQIRSILGGVLAGMSSRALPGPLESVEAEAGGR